MRRGRRRKYTGAGLRRAVEDYFDSITRDVPVTEQIWRGEKDADGHKIYESVPILNRKGQEVCREEYILPPSVGGLCAFLDITRETWSQWQDKERFPEFADTITRAQGRLRAWNEQELLERPGKDLKGIIFNLQNNYGYSEKAEVRVGGTVEEFLRSREGGPEM